MRGRISLLTQDFLRAARKACRSRARRRYFRFCFFVSFMARASSTFELEPIRSANGLAENNSAGELCYKLAATGGSRGASVTRLIRMVA
jgi:hypothetical protein